MIKTILAPVDFTEASFRSLDYAISIAKEVGAKVTVLHVYQVVVYNFPDGAYIPTADMSNRVVDTVQKQLDSILEERKLTGVPLEGLLRGGSPAEEITSVADELNFDLIVMGTHGRGLLGRAILGSVAQNVIRIAKQPVMTLRTSEK